MTYPIPSISLRCLEHFGQFVFPKAVFYKNGIVSQDGALGKRAMRIYPPWGIPSSRQAKNTQASQLHFFLAMDPNRFIDSNRVRVLFSLA